MPDLSTPPPRPVIPDGGLDGLQPDEVAGVELALDALREARVSVSAHTIAARGIVTGLLELARRRRQDRSPLERIGRRFGANFAAAAAAGQEVDTPDTTTLSTLDAGRATLRDLILAELEALDAGHVEDADELLRLAKAYTALGGDLELGRQERALEAEERVRELEAAVDSVLDAQRHIVEHGRGPLLYEGVLEPLGPALDRLSTTAAGA